MAETFEVLHRARAALDHHVPRQQRHAITTRAGLAYRALVTSVTLVTLVTAPAGASNLRDQRRAAATLYRQIQSLTDRYNGMSQRYDLSHIQLRRLGARMDVTRREFTTSRRVEMRDKQKLVQDATYAYVTARNSPSSGGSPFSNPTSAQAAGVYRQVVRSSLQTALTRYAASSIRLRRVEQRLASQRRLAATAMVAASRAVRAASTLLAALQADARRVTGTIAAIVRHDQATSAAAAVATLQQAQPVVGESAPPASPVAARAIEDAFSLIGVPYVWGGASRSGVDCSGLVLVAYAAAGIILPHYSGYQFSATMRVPLYDLQPGDILFYGPGGDEHETLYIGNGKVIQAERPGTTVTVSPVWFGPDFAGAGRPMA